MSMSDYRGRPIFVTLGTVPSRPSVLLGGYSLERADDVL
jgi:hypothetical protein